MALLEVLNEPFIRTARAKGLRSVAGWAVQNRTWSAFQGPGVRPGATRKVPSRLVDVCPTICYPMGFPYPDMREGAPLVDVLEG